jgi:hypothetical protein
MDGAEWLLDSGRFSSFCLAFTSPLVVVVMNSGTLQAPPSQDLATELLATATNAAALATALDKARRKAHALEYPRNAWIVVGSIIAFVAVCHWIGLLWTYTFARRHATNADQSPTSRRPIAINWLRLPLALTNVFRVVAFRWTISIGNDLTLNVMEIFLACAYAAIVCTWAFVNCEHDTLSPSSPPPGVTTTYLTPLFQLRLWRARSLHLLTGLTWLHA